MSRRNTSQIPFGLIGFAGMLAVFGLVVVSAAISETQTHPTVQFTEVNASIHYAEEESQVHLTLKENHDYRFYLLSSKGENYIAADIGHQNLTSFTWKATIQPHWNLSNAKVQIEDLTSGERSAIYWEDLL